MEVLVRTIPTSPSPLYLRRTRARFVCHAKCRGKQRLEPELMPNARRRKHDPLWEGSGLSLGIDLGNVRTGIALGKGIGYPQPLTVLRMKGQELEVKLVELAKQEDADELIVGLPTSLDGSETPQSFKVRAFVRELAVRAADKAEA